MVFKTKHSIAVYVGCTPRLPASKMMAQQCLAYTSTSQQICHAGTDIRFSKGGQKYRGAVILHPSSGFS